MTDILYSFSAVDKDIGTPLDCLVSLYYSPTSNSCPIVPTSDALDATFILGEFKAKDVASQAYSWFIGQHNVSIDWAALESFLTAIQTYTSTKYISVYIDIVAPKV